MTPILTNNYRLIPDIFTTFSIKLVDLFFFLSCFNWAKFKNTCINVW